MNDASGNVMAIYKREASGNLLPTKLSELPIYGSSRLGLVRRDVTVKMNAICVECGDKNEDEGPPPVALRIAEIVYHSPRPPRNTDTMLWAVISSCTFRPCP